MPRISLRNFLTKNKEVSAVITALLNELNGGTHIHDAEGNLIMGNISDAAGESHPVMIEEELAGYVKGNARSQLVANLISVLASKESEKKRLGSEVLTMYQEINQIYNFSEKLAQTIEPEAICRLALAEARHVIKSQSGVVVLWDEQANQLKIYASSGDTLFNEDQLTAHAGLLLKIGLSGQSEIMTDPSFLIENGILKPGAKSLIYAALKVKHRIMGAIILASNETVQYSAGDLKLLVTLALQSSSAIESALLYEKNIREVKEQEESMRRIHEVTKKFVPNEFIRSLGRDVITEVRLGDQVERVVTVLFTDIRDYTGIAEQMTPELNFRFVSSFNELMGPIIRHHNGFVVQYLGDAIMAIFPDSSEEALSAAVEMQIALQSFNQQNKSKNLPSIQIGIGMHTGSLIMGITGDEHRMNATMISDTVNTAARIESLTKYYKTNILLSEETLRLIPPNHNFHLRHLGMVQAKGKSAPVSIHECFSGYPKKEMESRMVTLDDFRAGMQHYLTKSFAKAISSFQKVTESNPEDLTARLFLANAARYISSGVPESWSGVEEMIAK